jgi:hypothetical protein
MFNQNITGRLADNLFAGAGFLGHKNEEITFYPGDATQAVTRLLVGGIDEFLLFLLLPGADMRPFGIDAVFFEKSFFDTNLAFATDSFFTAQSFDVRTQQP